MDIVVRFSEERNKKINRDIEAFAKAMSKKGQSAEYYAKNRNTSLSKAEKDVALGKKGEYFAFKFLVRNYSYPVIPMDLEIRHGFKKGWDVDLKFKDVHSHIPNVHVKSCNSFTRSYCNDFSWTFQYGNILGGGGKDDIFSGECNDDLIVFVYMEHYLSDTGVIKFVLPVGSLDKYLKDPIKKSNKGVKKCVYLKDLLLHEKEEEIRI